MTATSEQVDRRVVVVRTAQPSFRIFTVVVASAGATAARATRQAMTTDRVTMAR
jgi:hypothetical protein